MYSKEMLFDQLNKMNVPRNSVVTIHSSLRAIGETVGRGEGLLDALIEYVTSDGGLLVVPTHTWSNFFKECEYHLDVKDYHTCIGTLPDLAAAHKDGHRSEHPTHSVTVFGDCEKAEAFIAGDGETDTCTSPKGCYGRVFDNHGYVLLAGVGLERNTYLHCVEEMLDVKNRTSDNYSPVRIRRKDGTLLENNIRFMEAKGIGDVSAFFPKLEPAFRYHGCIQDGYLGNAKTMLCDAVKMKEVMELILRRSNGEELMADKTPLDESLYL